MSEKALLLDPTIGDSLTDGVCGVGQFHFGEMLPHVAIATAIALIIIIWTNNISEAYYKDSYDKMDVCFWTKEVKSK